MAHVNIEVYVGITNIKYINGYVYRGENLIILRMRDEGSRIVFYVAAQNIGPNEAH